MSRATRTSLSSSADSKSTRAVRTGRPIHNSVLWEKTRLGVLLVLFLVFVQQPQQWTCKTTTTAVVVAAAAAIDEDAAGGNCIIDANGETVCYPVDDDDDDENEPESDTEEEAEVDEEEEEERVEEEELSDDEGREEEEEVVSEEEEPVDEEEEEEQEDEEEYDEEYDDTCEDNLEKEPHCSMFAKDLSVCIEMWDHMSQHCRASCLLCNNVKAVPSKDNRNILEVYVHNVYSEKAPQLISNHYQLKSPRDHKQVERQLLLSDIYMYDYVYRNATYNQAKLACQNQHEHCSIWAAFGECDKNPDYMHVSCAPACQTCHKMVFELRCPFDRNEPGVWSKPGDLDAMFRRIATDPDYEPYKPLILSAPASFPDDQRRRFVSLAEQATWVPTLADSTKDGPWVLVLQNFLSADECETLIQLGAEVGYEISKDVGGRRPDGTYDAKLSKDRTSTNAWCYNVCADDPVTKIVLQRIENLTHIPETNYEHFQLLRYEVGQFYGDHHDYIPHQLERAEGVRILTVFMYLNDVEEGGGTHFSKLDLTVMPKRGSVLLWPSVLDHDPNEADYRTHHEALPVEKGIKYGANAWVHQKDFKTPYAQNCHN